MKCLGLDGRQYSLNLSQYQSSLTATHNKSSYHVKARELIKAKYTFNPIYEEVLLPGTRSERLYADFFLPTQRLLIEVHGEQHYNDIPFFYENHGDFLAAQSRDRKKVEWCDINGFTFVELSYKETEDEWKRKLC